jgi:hypothetical protein
MRDARSRWVAELRSGPRDATELYRALGVSRSTGWRYASRFESEGVIVRDGRRLMLNPVGSTIPSVQLQSSAPTRPSSSAALGEGEAQRSSSRKPQTTPTGRTTGSPQPPPSISRKATQRATAGATNRGVIGVLAELLGSPPATAHATAPGPIPTSRARESAVVREPPLGLVGVAAKMLAATPAALPAVPGAPLDARVITRPPSPPLLSDQPTRYALDEFGRPRVVR